MGGTARILSLSSTLIFRSPLLHYSSKRLLSISIPSTKRVFHGFRPICSSTTTVESDSQGPSPGANEHSVLLERLRLRHLNDNGGALKTPQQLKLPKSSKVLGKNDETQNLDSDFEELGLSEEVLAALGEMGISAPTEIQSIGIPAVLQRKSVVLGSYAGSGKTLAYLLPIIQLLRRDELELGIQMKSRRPRAIILCPTKELSEQVFCVAKCISHHAQFRSAMVSGGGRLRPLEDSLNIPVDMVVGTPGRILQHIEDGNLVFGDIRYLVLDGADTMFEHGFGPEIHNFFDLLKNRASKPNDSGFQTVLVAATMTNAVQKLIEEEFQGKHEVSLQVIEPSLAKGNRVMVFCNTLGSSCAVDRVLGENSIHTVNYHEEVPAEQRVENLRKFKTGVGDCPTLVCTDLAARGLELDAALGLLKDLDRIPCKKDVTLYNDLIYALSNSNRVDDCFELLREMKHHQVQPTHFTYNSIYLYYCRKSDLAGALDLVKEMRLHGHSPWIKHTTLLMKNLCNKGRASEACNFLSDIVKEGARPDIIPFSVALEGLLKLQRLDQAVEFFKDMFSHGKRPDVIAYNILIKGFCKAKRMLEAEELFKELLGNGLIPSPITYNSLIDGWCKNGNIEKALLCFSSMGEEVPNVVTYTTLIDGLSNVGLPDDAITLWDEMQRKGCSPNRIAFMALINGLCKNGKPTAALSYLKQMNEKELHADGFVYIALLSSFILKENASSAYDVLKEMIDKEIILKPEDKNHSLLEDAVLKLYADPSTSLNDHNGRGLERDACGHVKTATTGILV
ncbi:hypothetical protein V2J09_016728 [Rumex salicifolius]